MKFKSALVTSASGSIGGMTASRNRGGNYFRSRAIPTNPNTSFQQAVRNAMTSLVGQWQATLSQAQRDGWTDYAQSTPVINALGDEITLSGINMFTQCNVPRLQADLDPVLNRPPFNNFGPSPTIGLASLSEATQQVDVSFDTPDSWDDEDGSALLIYLSRPVNPGVSFFKGPYRLAAVVEGDSTTAPTSPATVDLPFAVTEGAQVFAQARLSRADGRLSPVFRDSATAGA